MGVNQLSLFWAKRDAHSEQYHPVICHLIDVANLALMRFLLAILRWCKQCEGDSRHAT